jgi:hypothetical protein
VREVGMPRPHRLSCYEAAAAVVTFANLLGCRLQPILVNRIDCKDMPVNDLWPLGRSEETGGKFHVHVVAGDFSQGTPQASLIYDPVLRLDTDAVPDAAPHTWEFPSAVPLGLTTSTAGAGHYLPQLILSKNLAASHATPITPPQVARPHRLIQFHPCELERWKRYRDELSKAALTPLAQAPTTFVIPGFSREDATPVPPPPASPDFLPSVPPRRRTLYRPLNPDTFLSRGQMLMADFWTGDAYSTLSFMAELLATADRPPTRIENPQGIVYAAPGGDTLWVLLQGATARLASIGPTAVNLMGALTQATPI